MVLEQVTLKKSQRLGVVSSWQSKNFEHIFQSGWKTQKLRQKLTPTHGTGETHVDLELYFTNERKSWGDNNSTRSSLCYSAPIPIRKTLRFSLRKNALYNVWILENVQTVRIVQVVQIGQIVWIVENVQTVRIVQIVRIGQIVWIVKYVCLVLLLFCNL